MPEWRDGAIDIGIMTNADTDRTEVERQGRRGACFHLPQPVPADFVHRAGLLHRSATCNESIEHELQARNDQYVLMRAVCH